MLLNCFAGCKPAAIVGALGLKMQDLFPPSNSRFPRLARLEVGNGKAPGRTFATGHEAVAALKH